MFVHIIIINKLNCYHGELLTQFSHIKSKINTHTQCVTLLERCFSLLYSLSLSNLTTKYLFVFYLFRQNNNNILIVFIKFSFSLYKVIDMKQLKTLFLTTMGKLTKCIYSIQSADMCSLFP